MASVNSVHVRLTVEMQFVTFIAAAGVAAVSVGSNRRSSRKRILFMLMLLRCVVFSWLYCVVVVSCVLCVRSSLFVFCDDFFRSWIIEHSYWNTINK